MSRIVNVLTRAVPDGDGAFRIESLDADDLQSDPMVWPGRFATKEDAERELRRVVRLSSGIALASGAFGMVEITVRDD